MDSSIPGLACIGVIVFLFVIPMWIYTLVAERQKRLLLASAIERGATEPVTIQPLVDLSVCMGSAACVTACPEEVFQVLEGQAVAVNMAGCIGHGACVTACPVGAIELVFGSNKRGIDIPAVGPDFQTNVPGLYIAGELGGMGLIVNAAEQGQKAITNATSSLKSQSGLLDVLIVGAGPAGISAAATAKSLGRSYALIEQDDLGGAVRHYPRKKVVFIRPIQVPGYRKVNLKTLRKEELVSLFEDIVQTLGIEISPQERAEKIEHRKGGGFSVTTTRRTIEAQRVLLALGRRGTPRKLGAVGEELEKVAYSLMDPEQYQYEHLLVVGAGDSAVEAALALSEQPGNRVTLSYRGDKINRPKAKNIQLLREAMQEGKVDVLLESSVKEITKDRVVLEQKGQEVVLPNDWMFVMVGGVLPVKFLKAAGINVQKHFGKRIEDDEPAAPRAPEPKPLPPELLPPVLPAIGEIGHDENTVARADGRDLQGNDEVTVELDPNILAAIDPSLADELTGESERRRANAQTHDEPTMLLPDAEPAEASEGGSTRTRTDASELLEAAESAMLAGSISEAEALLHRSKEAASSPLETALADHGLARCAALGGYTETAAETLSAVLHQLDGEDSEEQKAAIPEILLDAIEVEIAFGRYGIALEYADVVDARLWSLPDAVAAARLLRAEIEVLVGLPQDATRSVDTALGTPLSPEALVRAARVLCGLGRAQEALTLLDTVELPEDPLQDLLGQQMAVQALAMARIDPHAARVLASETLERRAPLSPVETARMRLDAARAFDAAGSPSEGRAAVKRGLKALQGCSSRGLRMELSLMLVVFGTEPENIERIRRSSSVLLAELPPHLASACRSRPEVAALFGAEARGGVAAPRGV